LQQLLFNCHIKCRRIARRGLAGFDAFAEAEARVAAAGDETGGRCVVAEYGAVQM
jgi:hypothetical protein